MNRMEKNMDRMDKSINMLVDVVRDGFSLLNVNQMKGIKKLSKISVVL
jgi:hypothetical protein